MLPCQHRFLGATPDFLMIIKDVFKTANNNMQKVNVHELLASR